MTQSPTPHPASTDWPNPPTPFIRAQTQLLAALTEWSCEQVAKRRAYEAQRKAYNAPVVEVV